jgi:Protein of unknown function (DUF2946)
MPTRFAAHCRRAIVLIAAWLVVLQALLAGAAAADPIAGATICHGSGASGPVDTTAPETGKVRHLCCAYCMSAAPAVAAPDVPDALQPRPVARQVAYSRFILVLVHQAVRAGRSQAPPVPA